MERLTDKDFNCMREFCDAKYCPNYEAEGCSGFEQYRRLKAYEETGLTPEEIKASRYTAAIAAAVAVQDAALYDDSALARADQLIERLERDLKRYREAEEHGRLFISPVKVGDMLWVVYWDEVLGAWGVDDVPERVNEVGSEGFFLAACLGDPEAPDEFHPYEEIGKEFFLTREKAVEAAAAKEKEVQGNA